METEMYCYLENKERRVLPSGTSNSADVFDKWLDPDNTAVACIDMHRGHVGPEVVGGQRLEYLSVVILEPAEMEVRRSDHMQGVIAQLQADRREPGRPLAGSDDRSQVGYELGAACDAMCFCHYLVTPSRSPKGGAYPRRYPRLWISPCTTVCFAPADPAHAPKRSLATSHPQPVVLFGGLRAPAGYVSNDTRSNLSGRKRENRSARLAGTRREGTHPQVELCFSCCNRGLARPRWLRPFQGFSSRSEPCRGRRGAVRALLTAHRGKAPDRDVAKRVSAPLQIAR